LGAELLKDSVYANIKPDRQKFRLFVAGLMGSKSGIVLVIVNTKNEPQGFLLGMVDELFYSRQKIATDLAVYVRPDHRHIAPKLFKRFISWAKQKPNLIQITLGVSSGSEGTERTGLMYERLGLGHVGGIYTEIIQGK